MKMTSNKSDLPLVCICVPTYNAAKTVRETLESILAQTYSNLIIHVSDNASTDDTLEVLNAFDDPRLHIHAYDENIGGEGNFNRCIQLAEGKYTAIFHADDVYERDMIEKQVAFLEEYAKIGAVFTEAKVIDGDGKITGCLRLPRSVLKMTNTYDFETIFKAVLLYSNFLICPSVMVRTEVYKNEIKHWNGGQFKTSSDLDVWFRILQIHKIGILPEQLVRYRIGDQQYSIRLRTRTQQSDLFLVLEYYLAQGDVKKILSKDDWKHFGWLGRTDRIVRAVNFYLSNDETMAKKMSQDILCFDALDAAFHSRRGIMTFTIGLCIKFFIYFKLSRIGKSLLLWLKRSAKK